LVESTLRKDKAKTGGGTMRASELFCKRQRTQEVMINPERGRGVVEFGTLPSFCLC